MRLWTLHPKYLDAKGLVALWREALLGRVTMTVQLHSTEGQLEYEWHRLLTKLRMRDPEAYRRNCGIRLPEAHPVFRISPGPAESWERVRHDA